jgi:uncharacterized membrane protein YgcG
MMKLPRPLLRRTLSTAGSIGIALVALVPAVIAAGPPFPEPVDNQAVYDTAGAFTPGTIEAVEAQIDTIEARTGAEIVVYTQLVPDGVTEDEAEAHAQALMDQWGVGRKGIDDGLVILFDLGQADPCHGQVQLYAGPGFRATFLTNEDRQAIFENDMLPYLRSCNFDTALLVAMDRIDAAATPENAARLEAARQLNAVIGLIAAPLVALLCIGGGLLRWRTAGKDPVYLDDPSILMPAPPPGLTPAAGAAVRDGSVSRRALTAASLDLASRGQIGFKAEGLASLAGEPEIGVYTGDAVTSDPVEQTRLVRARRRPMDDATRFLLGQLTRLGGARGYVEPDKLLKLGSDVSQFDARLEQHLVSEGWYHERPSVVKGRWAGRGAGLFVLGILAVILGFNLPSSGVVLLGASLIVSGIGVVWIGTAMPARTKAGSVIRAMLEAYRRTLEKTMAQARSMGEVAQASAIPLIEGPDDAVVWGVALGLQDEVEQVLQRSAEDLATGQARQLYMPGWYHAPGFAAARSSGGIAPGLMSASPIPNFGGMMAALGTIGNSPASSGSGSGGSSGGGGFSGGGSGGGGGGAGGGF